MTHLCTFLTKCWRRSLPIAVLLLALGGGNSRGKTDVAEPSRPGSAGSEDHDHAKAAESHAEDEGNVESLWAQVGPGFAIEGFEPEELRIRLSAKAQKRLGVGLGTAQREAGKVWVEDSALVYEDLQPQIYLVDAEGWFVRTPIRLGLRSGGRFEVLTGLMASHAYVTRQAPLIRMAELDLLAGDVAVSCH